MPGHVDVEQRDVGPWPRALPRRTSSPRSTSATTSMSLLERRAALASAPRTIAWSSAMQDADHDAVAGTGTATVRRKPPSGSPDVVSTRPPTAVTRSPESRQPTARSAASHVVGATASSGLDRTSSSDDLPGNGRPIRPPRPDDPVVRARRAPYERPSRLPGPSRSCQRLIHPRRAGDPPRWSTAASRRRRPRARSGRLPAHRPG